MAWNFAEVWETVAETLPDAPAARHGDVVRSWAELDRRADGVAAWLLSLGAARGDTAAQYLYSCTEYVEATFACFKLGVAPVNTNYRYAADELAYLWGTAGCVAVMFHGTFAPVVEELRSSGRVDQVRGWLWVDDGSGTCPGWADPYDEVAASAAPGARTVAPWGRSPDDLWLIYTGGTTGMPKGVMWRQDDMFAVTNAIAAVRYPEDGGLDDVRRMLVKPGPVHIPAAPLMHGTGMVSSFGALSSGGCIATLVGRSFDPTELLDLVQSARAKSIAIVGDAFCRPLLAALDAEPERWDLSSLRLITSSGVMWSQEVKEGMLRHGPRLILVDSLGSSEAISMANSVSTGDSGSATTGTFRVGASTVVLVEDRSRPVAPGTGEIGVVAMAGRVPVGYYGDPVKSAETFPVIGGVRYSVPGDYATVDADGTIRLLGRGSQCINTGGEKVYPEEVEEALKTHPAVRDAAVVGLPHPRFGEAVHAVVELEDGAAFDEAELIAHVKGMRAHYKVPRRIVAVPSTSRAANGKLDYRAIRATLESSLAAT